MPIVSTTKKGPLKGPIQWKYGVLAMNTYFRMLLEARLKNFPPYFIEQLLKSEKSVI